MTAWGSSDEGVMLSQEPDAHGGEAEVEGGDDIEERKAKVEVEAVGGDKVKVEVEVAGGNELNV